MTGYTIRFPAAPVDVFAGSPSWLGIDEPELHLYPTEERHLADSLAEEAANGRVVIITHSLHFASRFVGLADFVTFTSLGRFVRHESESVISSLLPSLSQDSAAIVSALSVLYVEGKWDEKIILELFPSEISKNRIVIAPLHGISAAEKGVATVWNRMLGVPIWVMVDNLDREELVREWGEAVHTVARQPQQRIAIARKWRRIAKHPNNIETKSIHELMAGALEQGIEHQLSFVFHGLSDISQVLSPERFGIEGSSWDDAGYLGEASFKTFIEEKTGANFDHAVARAWDFESARQWDMGSLTLLKSSLSSILNVTKISDRESEKQKI